MTRDGKSPEHRNSTAATEPRKWAVGDRCHTCRLGEWKNGTILAVDYPLVRVRRDGEHGLYHALAMDLRQAVDE